VSNFIVQPLHITFKESQKEVRIDKIHANAFHLVKKREIDPVGAEIFSVNLKKKYKRKI